MPDFLMAVLTMGTVVFAASSAAKLRGRAAFREFRRGLRATRLVPVRLADRAAVVVVAAETACGAGLLASAVAVPAAGDERLAAVVLACSTALTGVLVAGVAAVIRQGTTVRCPCFGAVRASPLGVVHLVRNALLLTSLTAGLVCGLLGSGRPELSGAALAALCGLVVALLFVRWEDLSALFAPSAQARSARRRR